jgi:outer membrane protein OmpA-like peptidoglycan-associated protein
MNIKKTMLSALLMLGFVSASAQEAKTVYDFNPHWYVQIQPLGAQYTLGEAKFKDLLSYNVQLAAGYNFNPIVGARFTVGAWQSKGGLDFQPYTWKWKYVAPGLDLNFNLSNLFCGYNPKRIFNFTVFGGFAANIGFDNDEAINVKNTLNALQVNSTYENLAYSWDETKCRIVGRFGAMADFRLSDAVSVGLEANANGLSDTYNSKRAGNADWYFNVLAGVKINLGKTYTERRVEAPKPVERVVERVVEKVVEKPVPATNLVQTADVVEPLRRDIFFTINSTKIVAAEQQKVNDIVAYMNKYPKSKVEVTGYADKGTGTAAINRRLAQQRAAVVVAALKKAGIAADRISSDSKGDTVQPFAENDKNRVSVCIAE